MNTVVVPYVRPRWQIELEQRRNAEEDQHIEYLRQTRVIGSNANSDLPFSVFFAFIVAFFIVLVAMCVTFDPDSRQKNKNQEKDES